MMTKEEKKDKNKKKSMIVLGAFVLIITIMFFFETNEKRLVHSYGKEVFAEVISYPKNCYEANSGYRKASCELKYNNKIYYKDTKLKMCEFISGKKEIAVLINDDNTRMQFKDEYGADDWAFNIFFLAIAVANLIIGIKGVYKK